MTPKYNPEKIVITGLGMVSSLGYDVITSCAAAMAGLTRVTEFHNLKIYNAEAGEFEPALGHAVALITDGFTGLGRLVSLGVSAINDLINNTKLTDWSKTGLFINLSSGFYLNEMEKAEEAELDEQSKLEFSKEPSEMQLRNQKYERLLIPLLTKLTNLRIDHTNSRIFFNDQTGMIQVIQAAIHSLQEKELERCIIGGIDSYLEDYFLAAFDKFNILKLSSNPVGFLPGEGASLILLESEFNALKRKARIYGIIEAPHESIESFNRLSDEPPLGIALFSTIGKTLESIQDRGQYTYHIIGDLNGDAYRAKDWGCALIRLKANYPFIEDIPLFCPASYFGEIGAATGPFAICLGIRGFISGYIKKNNFLVWLSSDTGTRGSFYIRQYKNKI